MRNRFWRFLLGLLLIASLATNAWLGGLLYQNAERVRQGTAYLTWGTNYALNGMVPALEEPGADWNSPRFQANLLRLFEWATLYAESASATMGGMATGPYDDVLLQLNALGFRLTDYRSLIHTAIHTGQFPVTSKEQLLNLAANLRRAGWPQKPVSRDNAAEWSKLAADLKKLLELEGAQGTD